MSMASQVRRITPEEYLRFERVAHFKSEYVNGEVLATAGGTLSHSLIQVNLTGEVRTGLKGQSCTPYNNDLRVKVWSTNLYTYPDLSVFCDGMTFDDEQGDTALNPTVLFEVLSPSTEKWDRGEKFKNYRSISSLREYVLVTQDSTLVEVFLRQENAWRMTEFCGLETSARIESIDIDLPLSELYDRVTFPESIRTHA